MQALVLAAHGSRREASNLEVKSLAQRLKAAERGAFRHIEAGFLEIASPTIPEAIQFCVQAGASTVVVVPYFLSAGRHVSEDVPGIVDRISPQYPGTAIHIAKHIGASDAMTRLILEAAGPYTAGGETSTHRQAV
jgi:sirohydrochlorin ferrochelatase